MAGIESAQKERSMAGRLFGFFRRRKKRPQTDVRRRIGESWYTPYLFILPHLIIFILFIGVPFFLGIWISVHDSTALREGPFVGFRNFENLKAIAYWMAGDLHLKLPSVFTHPI